MVWCDTPTSLADFGLTFAICQPPLGCVDPILCQLGLSAKLARPWPLRSGGLHSEWAAAGL